MGIRDFALFDADGVFLLQGGLVKDLGGGFVVEGGLTHDLREGLCEVAVAILMLGRDLQYKMLFNEFELLRVGG
jgi:hypothetical protein